MEQGRVQLLRGSRARLSCLLGEKDRVQLLAWACRCAGVQVGLTCALGAPSDCLALHMRS